MSNYSEAKANAMLHTPYECQQYVNPVVLAADTVLAKKDKELAQLRDENEQLLSLSMNLDEHPDDYDGPCLCKSCQSYIEAVDAE
jgi:hypothetical protein